MAKLIKVDKNGSKHYEGFVTCDRCGGDGIYKWGAVQFDAYGHFRSQYAGTCFKCDGAGKVFKKWIERTPEYQAELDRKREERARKKAEQWERENAERIEAERREAERLEAEIKAQKAISQYVGEIGERLMISATFEKEAIFDVPSFRGFGTDTMHIYTFVDKDGNKFIWKTTSVVMIEKGTTVELKGTVKEHSEFRDEKQTVLTRCKVK